MSYVYKQTEYAAADGADLFTVGCFIDGKWEAESDHPTNKAAAQRCAQLNGQEIRSDHGDRLTEALAEAERKAIDALARYKFQMFGYWAAIWVHLNRIGELNRPNPFAELVKQARRMK